MCPHKGRGGVTIDMIRFDVFVEISIQIVESDHRIHFGLIVSLGVDLKELLEVVVPADDLLEDDLAVAGLPTEAHSAQREFFDGEDRLGGGDRRARSALGDERTEEEGDGKND